jgi:hypothetical protein
MTDLKSRKPHPSFIKLIESAGILLNVPLSNEKSLFKAPLPSNYDTTITMVSENFHECLHKISSLQSCDIGNEMASAFYNKFLEPGFDYEDAVNAVGLLGRDLFNAIYLVLMRLQADINRPPIHCQSMSVYLDGTRASYVALDVACHLHNHGTLNVIATSVTEESTKINLLNDIRRRCRDQYKKAPHTFNVKELGSSGDIVELRQLLRQQVSDSKSTVFLMGLSDWNIGADSSLLLPLWATWEYRGDAVFTKGISTVRSFKSAKSPRKFNVFIDSSEDPRGVFIKALKFIRSGDELLLTAIVESRDPVGDNRDSRFGVGDRYGWVSGDTKPPGGPDSVGWNDTVIVALAESLQKLITESFVNGRYRIDTVNEGLSTAQQFSQVSMEESCDFMVISEGNHRDIIVECIKDSKTSLIVVK